MSYFAKLTGDYFFTLFKYN